jgi:hypothetical protein
MKKRASRGGKLITVILKSDDVFIRRIKGGGHQPRQLLRRRETFLLGVQLIGMLQDTKVLT